MMALTLDRVSRLRDNFYASNKNALAQNIVSRSGPQDSCLSKSAVDVNLHIFSHKVDEGKSVTNQKNSGRCWIFACLNAMRIPFKAAKNIEDFEFSQSFLYFWDKVERSNFFLNNIVQLYHRNPREHVGGRLVDFLLMEPISDGGQWDMIANLINKHGVMPKSIFPETFSSDNSRQMNGILKSKLRQFALELHDKLKSGVEEADIKALVGQQMETVYRIVGICLGIPPETFTWEYYDKEKKYHKVGPITPLDFYHLHVRPVYDVETKVCLVSDPRPSNRVGQTYMIDCLGNVVGGRKTIYNNQPIETLIDVSMKSLQAGEAVWLGCEIGKFFASKEGLLDTKVLDYKLVFDTEVSTGLSKAERLIYGDSSMSHAMLFTAVQIENEKPTKWRVENSWGEERGNKGYLLMTTNWFKEFVFEVVIDRSFCSKEILDVYDKEPIILPAWDPMGALAQ